MVQQTGLLASSLVSRLLVATGDTCKEVGNLRVGRSGTWMGQSAQLQAGAAFRQALTGFGSGGAAAAATAALVSGLELGWYTARLSLLVTGIKHPLRTELVCERDGMGMGHVWCKAHKPRP